MMMMMMIYHSTTAMSTTIITLVFNNIIKHTKNTRERLTVLTSASLWGCLDVCFGWSCLALDDCLLSLRQSQTQLHITSHQNIDAPNRAAVYLVQVPGTTSSNVFHSH